MKPNKNMIGQHVVEYTFGSNTTRHLERLTYVLLSFEKQDDEFVLKMGLLEKESIIKAFADDILTTPITDSRKQQLAIKMVLEKTKGLVNP